jgi:hypothetical protein
MMEAASTSETSVNFYQTTRRNISEDSHLQLLDPIRDVWIVDSAIPSEVILVKEYVSVVLGLTTKRTDLTGKLKWFDRLVWYYHVRKKAVRVPI